MKGLPAVITVFLLSTLASHAQAPKKPIELAFPKLLAPSSRSLQPTPLLTGANGKRVTITGHMALMEHPPHGGFWLCPSPVFQDESGAGTGDLPPNAIFVKVRGAGDQEVAFLRGSLVVTGVLHLQKEAPRIQITLDSDKDIAQPKAKP